MFLVLVGVGRVLCCFGRVFCLSEALFFFLINHMELSSWFERKNFLSTNLELWFNDV
jgi:hypothetical protein